MKKYYYEEMQFCAILIRELIDKRLSFMCVIKICQGRNDGQASSLDKPNKGI